MLNVISFLFRLFCCCDFLFFFWILQWFDDRMFSDLCVKFTHSKLHLNSSHTHTHTHFGFIRCLNNLCEFETELIFRSFFDLFRYPILFSVRTCIECVTIFFFFKWRKVFQMPLTHSLYTILIRFEERKLWRNFFAVGFQCFQFQSNVSLGSAGVKKDVRSAVEVEWFAFVCIECSLGVD